MLNQNTSTDTCSMCWTMQRPRSMRRVSRDFIKLEFTPPQSAKHSVEHKLCEPCFERNCEATKTKYIPLGKLFKQGLAPDYLDLPEFMREEKRSMANIKERNVEKYLTFKLTQEDLADKAKKCAQLRKETMDLQAEFDDLKEQFKSKISLKESQISSHLAVIRAGEEERHVHCTEQMDYDNLLVNYIYNGEVMLQRAMEPHERQLTMIDTNANAKRTKRRADVDGDDEVEERSEHSMSDIRSSLIEETSRKSKRSAVDGPSA